MNDKKRSFVHCVLVLILSSALFMLTACQISAPGRSFTTLELLVSVDDLPPGWVVKDLRMLDKHQSDENTDDSAIVAFVLAVKPIPGRPTQQRVYRYKNSTIAQAWYKDLFLTKPGQKPEEWSFQSSTADEADIQCYDYEGRDYTFCEWTARYQEYVVDVMAFLIPDKMSLQDFEKIVIKADSIISQHLDDTSSQ